MRKKKLIGRGLSTLGRRYWTKAGRRYFSYITVIPKHIIETMEWRDKDKLHFEAYMDGVWIRKAGPEYDEVDGRSAGRG